MKSLHNKAKENEYTYKTRSFRCSVFVVNFATCDAWPGLDYVDEVLWFQILLAD